MKYIFGVIILCFVLQRKCVILKKLPNYIEYCHRNDPKIADCVRRAVEILRPRLAKGVPELYIPPMDPLVLPEVSMQNGDSFKAVFRNIRIYHADKFILKDLKADFVNEHLEFSVRLPKLRITTDYKLSGRILILQLNGNGKSDGNFTNVDATLTVDGMQYMKNGKGYMKIINKKMDLKLGKPVLHFDNIFRNNRQLNDQTNKIVNENIADIIDELKPVINDTIINFVFGLVERIFDKYSIDDLFPK